MRKTIKFEIDLDENHLPVDIKMNTSEDQKGNNKIKALMISAWASKNKETW